MSIHKNIILNSAFTVLFLELFLMGSGRSLQFGPVTLRMIFFMIAISLSIFVIFKTYQVNKTVFLFASYFSLLLFYSSLTGLINGAPIQQILSDVKPLTFFFMILPFSLFLNNKKSIALIVKLIKYSALTMAIIYITWYVVMYLGLLDFQTMYALLSNESNEIMFRGTNHIEPGLFYKSFVYMCIGFIFFVHDKHKGSKFIAIFLLLAIVLTFTRGFIVALVLAFIFKNIIDIKEKRSFIFLVTMLIFLSLAIPYYIVNVGAKAESDSLRILQIIQVFDNIDLVSLFIGHGFGIGVPIRPDHMEISYLEIFHKQGLIGLFFWISILFFITMKYIKIEQKTPYVISFFVGAIFVFMQSLTNPFINNPIGISMILISLISLNYIEKNQYSMVIK